MQLAWDPVEGSGLLAPPITEPFPPIILQAGLGDPTIPREATEALARAYKACVVPNNPRRNIFGLTQLNSMTALSRHPCNVTLTELLYKEEYPFPLDDVSPGSSQQHSNVVHMCLRQDCALISQMTHFINTGEVIDPCESDQCVRSNVSCFLNWRKNNTKPSNWTCPADW